MLKMRSLWESTRTEQGLLIGSALVLALLVYGWILVPSAVPILPALVLVAYGAIAHLGGRTLQRSDPRLLTATAVCGVVAAAVLVPSLLIEYIGKTVNNGIMFGTAALLWFLAGILAASRTGRIRDAVLSSTLSGMLSSLANVAALLASYYILRGSALQDRFFRTEGDYEDFAHSGATDFIAWAVADMFGGAFFHLLLGVFIAAALGTVAGSLVIALTRTWRRATQPRGRSDRVG
jgi:hypothetical protein